MKKWKLLSTELQWPSPFPSLHTPNTLSKYWSFLNVVLAHQVTHNYKINFHEYNCLTAFCDKGTTRVQYGNWFRHLFFIQHRGNITYPVWFVSLAICSSWRMFYLFPSHNPIVTLSGNVEIMSTKRLTLLMMVQEKRKLSHVTGVTSRMQQYTDRSCLEKHTYAMQGNHKPSYAAWHTCQIKNI